MAALALPPVLTQVHVILLMTGEAARIELHLVRRLLVAAFAGELAVRSGESESSLPAVIEFPQPPAIRRVAFRAVRSEAAVMYVVALVAVVAAMAGIAIFACAMALLASHRDVQA